MKEYTLNIYCENKVGIITKLTLIFTRRRINIESFIASKTEIDNVYKITLAVKAEKYHLEKIIKHVEKIVEVYKAFLHEKDEVVSRQLGLYKVGNTASTQKSLMDVIKNADAKVTVEEQDFWIIEKTGSPDELQSLLLKLGKFNLIEYASSGRVAVVKWSKKFHQHLINLSVEKAELYS